MKSYLVRTCRSEEYKVNETRRRASLQVRTTVVLGPLLSLALGTQVVNAAFSIDKTFDDPTPTDLDFFGESVAIYGNRVLAGAWGDDTAGSEIGQAHLFDATTGALLHTFDDPTPTDTDVFGSSVAIDGNHVLIGAAGDDTISPNVGQAYLFDVTTGALLQTFDDPTPTDSDVFGSAVAIDGNHVLIGAPGADTIGPNVGQAHLFDAATGALLQTFDDPSPTDSDAFGSAVFIDASLVLIGASRDDSIGTNVGQAHLFDAITGALLRTFNDPTPTDGDRFGSSGAIDGNYVLIGAPGDDTINPNVGQAHLFDATTGALLQTFNDPTNTAFSQDSFGSSVAIDANRVLVGAHTDDTFGRGVGQAHLYDATTGALLQTFNDPSPLDLDNFGSSVVIDSSRILIGERADGTNGPSVGQAHLYIDDTFDGDGDGVPDVVDPDMVAMVVDGLLLGTFANAADPNGQRNALLKRLQDIETAIAAGNTEEAIRLLQNLRRTVDGCPDTPTAFEMSDMNDWITDCDAQREIRALIDLLIANLSA